MKPNCDQGRLRVGMSVRVWPGVKRGMRCRHLLTTWAVSVTLAVGAGAQTLRAGSSEQPQGASKAWLPYAQSLVGREQAIGVVLLEDEIFSRLLADLSTDVTTSVAEVRRGSVVRLVSERALRCRRALERPVVPLVLRGTPLAVLYDLVTQDPEASTRLPPGLLGGGGPPSARSRERIAQEISIDLRPDSTLETALDQLVLAGVPLGWGVIERGETSATPCQIILFTEDSVLWTGYDALYPTPPPPKILR